MAEEKLCSVCNKNEAIGVASSCLGPMSYSFCGECLFRGAESEAMCSAVLELNAGYMADWVREKVKVYKDGEYLDWDDWAMHQPHDGVPPSVN